jgi:hypothetical protein
MMTAARQRIAAHARRRLYRESLKDTPPGSKYIVPAAPCLKLGPCNSQHLNNSNNYADRPAL